MDRGRLARLLLGASIGIGGLAVVVAVATGNVVYVSGIVGVVCVLNGVLLTYVNWIEDEEE